MAKYSIILFLFGLTLIVKAQPTVDSSFVSDAKKNAISLYTNTSFAHSALYNGHQYDEYRPVDDEHPYLFLDWVEGTIIYSKKKFEGVALLYDLSSDQIITEHSSGNKISLLREKIEFFVIKGHRYEFIKIPSLTEGFYDILYKGKISIMARREKSRQEKLSGSTIHVEFEEKVKYYLLKNNRPTLFSNRRTLIKAIAGNEPEIKKQLSSAKFDFRNQKEFSFAALAKLYDQITTVK